MANANIDLQFASQYAMEAACNAVRVEETDSPYSQQVWIEQSLAGIAKARDNLESAEKALIAQIKTTRRSAV